MSSFAKAWCFPSPNAQPLMTIFSALIWKVRCTRSAPSNSSSTPAVGTVIQSYLYRSETDIQDLLAYGCRIRLCKGAYKESSDVAYPRKRDTDFNYIRLMKILLPSGFYHGIATHDPLMIAETIRWAAARQISKDDF